MQLATKQQGMSLMCYKAVKCCGVVHSLSLYEPMWMLFNQYLFLLQFVVHEVPGQDLEVDLYDEDPDKDDFMGR